MKEYIENIILIIEDILDLFKKALDLRSSVPVKKKSGRFMKKTKSYCIDSKCYLAMYKIMYFLKFLLNFVIGVFLCFFLGYIIGKVSQNTYIIIAVKIISVALLILRIGFLKHEVYSLIGEVSGSYVLKDKLNSDNTINTGNEAAYVKSIADIRFSGLFFLLSIIPFGYFYFINDFTQLLYKYIIATFIAAFVMLAFLLGNFCIILYNCWKIYHERKDCFLHINRFEVKNIIIRYNSLSVSLDAYRDQISVRDDGTVYVYYQIEESLMKSLFLNTVDSIEIGNYKITYNSNNNKWDYSL